MMICTFALGACANNYAQLDTPQHQQIIQDDKAKIDVVSEVNGTIDLSLAQAIDRAVHYNLDARVSALEVLSKEDNITLEKLKALPAVGLSAGYQGRSNLGASSSRSVISGNQSLEPSISAEPHRRTSDLSLNWNVIDVALSVMQSNSAKDETLIARERHSKVLQNIQRDVYAAYWRAYAAHKNNRDMNELVFAAEKHLAAIDQAVSENLIAAPQAAQRKQPLERQLAALKRTMERVSLADIELKSLLSLDQDTEIRLTSHPDEYLEKAHGLLLEDIENLEIQALENRPEMRETIAKRNITLRETRIEVVKTFPGIKFFYAVNYDSNSFLDDARWQSFSATIAQSITSLITAPSRYQSAKNRETLEEERRVSLAAAIITQIHLSRARLEYLLDVSEMDSKAAMTADTIANATQIKHEEGFASGIDTTTAQLEALNARINSLLSIADAQEAAATFLESLGQDAVGGLL